MELSQLAFVMQYPKLSENQNVTFEKMIDAIDNGFYPWRTKQLTWNLGRQSPISRGTQNSYLFGPAS
jgi:succinate dehydrogenase flavin-adding protein (antitoxin of CptAB toxin-antitoxin module)